LWKNFVFSLFNIYIGVGQGSVLSLILSALYISLVFYILEKRSKNLNIPALFLSFVDNGLIISQEKSFEKTNTFLFCSYDIILFLLKQFGLVIKHEKSKIFHFLNLMEYSISLLSISVFLEDLFFTLKTSRDI